MKQTAPIGVFDSGVGGLSVLKEIRKELPAEDLLYVADSAYAPYGNKGPDFIQQRTLAIASFLLDQKVKALVVACNTATATAIASLRQTFNLPIIGMEPAIKPAVAATKTGIVGILATEGTLSSARFAALLGRFSTETSVLTQPAHGLVELVEKGQLDRQTAYPLLSTYIHPLLEQGADTIILGCTHYAFLSDIIRQIVGPNVAIISTGEAVAKHLKQRLLANQTLHLSASSGSEVFWTSGDIDTSHSVFVSLWGKDQPLKKLPINSA